MFSFCFSWFEFEFGGDCFFVLLLFSFDPVGRCFLGKKRKEKKKEREDKEEEKMGEKIEDLKARIERAEFEKDYAYG